jgi:hypothetical protein
MNSNPPHFLALKFTTLDFADGFMHRNKRRPREFDDPIRRLA